MRKFTGSIAVLLSLIPTTVYAQSAPSDEQGAPSASIAAGINPWSVEEPKVRRVKESLESGYEAEERARKSNLAQDFFKSATDSHGNFYADSDESMAKQILGLSALSPAEVELQRHNGKSMKQWLEVLSKTRGPKTREAAQRVLGRLEEIKELRISRETGAIMGDWDKILMGINRILETDGPSCASPEELIQWESLRTSVEGKLASLPVGGVKQAWNEMFVYFQKLPGLSLTVDKVFQISTSQSRDQFEKRDPRDSISNDITGAIWFFRDQQDATDDLKKLQEAVTEEERGWIASFLPNEDTIHLEAVKDYPKEIRQGESWIRFQGTREERAQLIGQLFPSFKKTPGWETNPRLEELDAINLTELEKLEEQIQQRNLELKKTRDAQIAKLLLNMEQQAERERLSKWMKDFGDQPRQCAEGIRVAQAKLKKLDSADALSVNDAAEVGSSFWKASQDSKAARAKAAEILEPKP